MLSLHVESCLACHLGLGLLHFGQGSCGLQSLTDAACASTKMAQPKTMLVHYPVAKIRQVPGEWARQVVAGSRLASMAEDL